MYIQGVHAILNAWCKWRRFTMGRESYLLHVSSKGACNKTFVVSVLVCKKCGFKANQVAHKNYKRIFKEKLKDVEPSCPKCNKEEYKIRTAR